jgi:hypothetical protein
LLGLRELLRNLAQIYQVRVEVGRLYYPKKRVRLEELLMVAVPELVEECELYRLILVALYLSCLGKEL